MRSTIPVSIVWLFCMAGFGLFFPYFSLYLRENLALSGFEVGVVLGALPMMGVLAQPIWGVLADRTGSRTRILSLLALCAAVGYTSLPLASSFTGVLGLTMLLAVFATPLIPTHIAVTLAVARDLGPNAFGLCRVCGTIGFLIMVVSFPAILDLLEAERGLVALPDGPSEPALAAMFPLAGALVALGGLAAFAIPRRGAVSVPAARGDAYALARHGPYVRVVLFALLGYVLMQGPMTFFPVFITAHGGTLDTVSRMWIPMILLEIPLVAFSGASLARLGPRGLLAVGTIAGGIRWTVCGLAPYSSWVLPMQLLHGVTVAGLVLGAPLYVEQVVPEALRATGQNVLAMLGVSLGGILSNLAMGWFVDHTDPATPYVVSGVGALVLAALIPLLLPPTSRPGPPSSAALSPEALP
jgi:PPP family 3-phenylpropionic acid transporter